MDKMMKLQNILFPKNELIQHWHMFYRGDRFSHNIYESAHCLKKDQQTEFFTYFNAFSLEKWKKYTAIDHAYLQLKVKGTLGIQLFGHYMNNNIIEKEVLSENYYECDETETILIPIPFDVKSQVVSFQVFAYSDISIYEGSYLADISTDKMNEVELSLVTVTFRKEDFITRNLRLIENEIIYSDEEIADHIFVRVIDNGRTLNTEEWNGERIHIYQNPNVGGSGGYTRGMIETLRDETFNATHALLMDDDVKILPESIIRTYNLLRCLKPEYRDHFISGAMLYYEKMHVQHEDVGFVSEDGTYGPRKPSMEMHLATSVLLNEKIYEDQPNNYAGWWYCCIPRTKLSLDRLSLPLFIRGDDVEFSIANHAKFITMNGICIWHMGFVTKFNMPMEFYQVHRNSLIIQATSGVTPEVDYLKRIKDIFDKEISRYNYVGCDLLLDAVDDFLKGPEFLMKPEGETIMKQQTSRVKPLVDIRQNFADIYVDYDKIYKFYEGKLFSKRKLKRYFKTHNWQLLPKFMMNHEPAVVAYDWFDIPEKQYRHDVVLAVNPHNQTGVLRYRSRSEYLRLMKRYREIRRNYNKNMEKVTEAYKKSTHNRRERPVYGHCGWSRGRFYYRITTFEGRPWDARDPHKTTFMALKHAIRLSIWRKQKETPGVEKAPGVSSPQRKGYGELRFGVRPGHPRKAVTSISQAEALAHGLTHLHHLVFAAVLARELDWCAALQDAREDARPWGVVGIGLRSDVWVEVRRDDHRPAVLVTRVDDVVDMPHDVIGAAVRPQVVDDEEVILEEARLRVLALVERHRLDVGHDVLHAGLQRGEPEVDDPVGDCRGIERLTCAHLSPEEQPIHVIA